MSLVIEQALPSPSQFPNTFAIALSDFSAISLKGEENSKYLQGQVTCDVNATTENSLIHGAHCDAKGKTYSVFRMVNRLDAHLLIQPKASIGASLAALQKFGVFAKVDIEEAKLSYYALVGDQATALLQQQFNAVPDSLTPVIQAGSTSLVYIAGEIDRYLLIDDSDAVVNFIQTSSLPIFGSAVWTLQEIKEGFPILSETAISEYVPQMLNVQAIHGISFTKGCYLGQETVARMQYLGKNKRALFSLKGQTDSHEAIGDTLEKQLGENWRKAGDILSSYQADDGSIYVQAVLANDIEEDNNNIRSKASPSVELSVASLPYSLIQS